MSKTWKWILGILGVLLIIGIVAAAAFMWQGHMGLQGARVFTYSAPGSPDAPRFGDRYDGYGWHRMDDPHRRLPMMHDRFAMPYAYGPLGLGLFAFGGLLRLVLPLAVLAGVAFLFYQLGRRAGSSSAASPSGPASPPASPRKVARR